MDIVQKLRKFSLIMYVYRLTALENKLCVVHSRMALCRYLLYVYLFTVQLLQDSSLVQASVNMVDTSEPLQRKADILLTPQFCFFWQVNSLQEHAIFCPVMGSYTW